MIFPLITLVRKAFFGVCLLLIFTQSSISGEEAAQTRKEFKDYWYSQGAEISRFTLQQSRYGEIHLGDAVLIYVTEEMNPELQVKADHPTKTSIPILKLNFMRKFYTGIYPYSIMTSVFSPIDIENQPFPLKTTFSAQEWCGQVFMQMNLKGEKFHVQSRSYFESESDQNSVIEKELTEDGLWTLIRIAPQKLPTGSFRLIPGSTYTRLLHKPMTAADVVGAMDDTAGKSLEGNSLRSYSVRFPGENRILKITFEKDFPHRIQKWEDTHSSIFGQNPLTTIAIRTHSIMTDYWNKHSNVDRELLQKLGLGEKQ